MERSGWLSARGLTMLAGGASLGLVAGRLMPPLLMQTGRWLGRSGKDAFALLAEDHRHFLGLLTEMQQCGEKPEAHRTQLLARLKRGLAAHTMVEEDVIYPLLAEEAGAHSAADQLYAEHGAMKTHLYALERMISDGPAWAERSSALKQLVAKHARQEETVEFPRLRRLLDEAATEQVARQVRREKAPML